MFNHMEASYYFLRLKKISKKVLTPSLIKYILYPLL